MKNLLTFILMLLISFAYSYETIAYFSKGDAASHCEENSAEAEESSEKSEKSEKEKLSDDDYFNNLHLQNKLISGHIELAGLAHSQNNNFCSADYSHEVYSPPEML